MRGNNRGFLVHAAVVLALTGLTFGFGHGGLAADAPGGPKVTSIDFKGTQDPSEIQISLQGTADAQKQVNTADKQVIIDIPGATLSSSAKRRIDTSSFNGLVSLVSPYELNDKSGVRVVVQLRKNVDVNFVQEPGMIRLRVPNSMESASTTPETSATTSMTGNNTAASTEAVAEAQTATAPKSDLEHFVESTNTKSFTGKPITLQVRDADVRDVFNLIADTSGFNIILAPDVSGKITLSLVDVPWDQALSVVLQTLGLGADRKGNILRVMTLTGLTKEKIAEQAAKQVTEAITPRITRVFPVSYAKLDSLRDTIENLISQESQPQAPAKVAAPSGVAAATTGVLNVLTGAVTPPVAQAPATGGGSTLPKVGDVTVLVDDRTNSLIVRTTPEKMDRVKKIIDILDTQTPQVLIEGKVIEASETFGKKIGGNFGISDLGLNPYAASFNGSNPVDALLGSSGQFNGAQFAQTSIGGGAFGYSLLPSGTRINLFLQIAENEQKVKVVASPKTVVLNKQTANVTQGTPVLVPSNVIGPNGVVIATSTQQTANLSLNVTPTVTSDGSVLMDLTLERDIPTSASGSSTDNAIATRQIKTSVLVDSGATLVMGGFYTNTDSEISAGFPYLRKIPIIGWLFGNDSKTIDKSEIFFFITPQIINPKKSGVSS